MSCWVAYVLLITSDGSLLFCRAMGFPCNGRLSSHLVGKRFALAQEGIAFCMGDRRPGFRSVVSTFGGVIPSSIL